MVSVATAKVEGRRRSCTGAEGCPLDPFDATDESSGCSPSQAAIRRTMIVFNHQFGKFSHSRCVNSQTSVTRQASRQRKEPLVTEIDVNACEVRRRPPPAVMTVMHGFPDNNSLSIIRYEKASQVFEEKELDKHSAVWSCQAGGSGECVARNRDWAAVTASLSILAHVAQSCCMQAARMPKSRSSTHACGVHGVNRERCVASSLHV